MAVSSVKELLLYRKSYAQAMAFFDVSRGFPLEERFALTSQGRRASRSVVLNLREAWAKRRYKAHFISKLTDCDGENAETDTCLDFAHDGGYITGQKHAEWAALNREIGKMIGAIIKNPLAFLVTPDS